MTTSKKKSRKNSSPPLPNLPTTENLKSFWTTSDRAAWAGTIVTGIGIFGALIFNALSLKEATNQRRASYQPDLVITHTLVNLKVACSNNRAEGKVDIQYSPDLKHWSNDQFKLQVINVGKGAARDIGYLWNAGTKEQLDKLKSYGIEPPNGTTELQYNGTVFPYYSPDTIVNQDFVLTPDQGKASEIVPSPYLNAELTFQTVAYINKFGCSRFSNHPPLKGPILDIQYHDIERNYFHAEFEANYFPYAAIKSDITKDGSGTLLLPYEIRMMSRGERSHQAAWQEPIKGL